VELLGKPVLKTDSCIGPDAKPRVAALADGDVLGCWMNVRLSFR